jgi:hypothetical protein
MYSSEDRNVKNGSDVWLHKSKLITSSYCQGNRTASELTIQYLPSLSANTAIMATFFSFLLSYVTGRVLFSPQNRSQRVKEVIFSLIFFAIAVQYTLTVFDFRESQDSNPDCRPARINVLGCHGSLSLINSIILQLISLQAFMCGSVSQNLFPISRTKASHRV